MAGPEQTPDYTQQMIERSLGRFQHLFERLGTKAGRFAIDSHRESIPPVNSLRLEAEPIGNAVLKSLKLENVRADGTPEPVLTILHSPDSGETAYHYGEETPDNLIPLEENPDLLGEVLDNLERAEVQGSVRPIPR